MDVSDRSVSLPAGGTGDAEDEVVQKRNGVHFRHGDEEFCQVQVFAARRRVADRPCKFLNCRDAGIIIDLSNSQIGESAIQIFSWFVVLSGGFGCEESKF